MGAVYQDCEFECDWCDRLGCKRWSDVFKNLSTFSQGLACDKVDLLEGDSEEGGEFWGRKPACSAMKFSDCGFGKKRGIPTNCTAMAKHEDTLVGWIRFEDQSMPGAQGAAATADRTARGVVGGVHGALGKGSRRFPIVARSKCKFHSAPRNVQGTSQPIAVFVVSVHFHSSCRLGCLGSGCLGNISSFVETGRYPMMDTSEGTSTYTHSPNNTGCLAFPVLVAAECLEMLFAAYAVNNPIDIYSENGTMPLTVKRFIEIWR